MGSGVNIPLPPGWRPRGDAGGKGSGAKWLALQTFSPMMGRGKSLPGG